MRYILTLLAVIMITSLVPVSPAGAETRYVGDQLIITLRQGKSTKHKILKTLSTGTPVEVLEDEDESYLKVRTGDGTEGYVLRQYISSSPPQALRLEELEKQNSSLQKQVSELQGMRNDLEAELKSLKGKYDQDLSELTSKSAEAERKLEQTANSELSLSEKYDTLLAQSENVVALAAERDQLLQENQKLAVDIQTLVQKNDTMSDNRMIKWFLAGGSVFLFGWIIGKISRKKRSRY